MLADKKLDFSRIAQDLQIRKVQVENVVRLLDDGNTIPFITRYRKEQTGGLDEDIIRQIKLRTDFQRQLYDRKQTILKSIENQGKLTPELREAILTADTSRHLEDLYLPFKPKKRTLATTARERGLEPLALAIWNRDPAVSNLPEILPTVINPEKELNTATDVENGVQHILAEMVNECADVRAAVRSVMWETGKLVTHKNEKVSPEKGKIFRDYFEFTEPARRIPPHRILAINRGEREGVLKVKLDWDAEKVKEKALAALAHFCQHQYEAGQLPTPASPEPAPVSPETVSTGTEPSAPPTATEPATTESTTTETAPPADTPQPESAESPAPPEQPAPEGEPAAPADSAGAEQSTAPAETPPAESEPAPAESSETAAEPTSASSPAPQLPSIPVANEGEPLCPAVQEYHSPHAEFLRKVVDDALNRLVCPSLEKEIRRELREEAETHAVHIFACNLRSLLLQRPVHNRRVLAIDPGFRTGCKIVALDEYGNLLDHSVIYPHPIKKKKKKKEKKSGAEKAVAKKADTPAAEDKPKTESQEAAAPTPETAPTTTDQPALEVPAVTGPEAAASPAPEGTATPATPEATAENAAPAPESPPAAESSPEQTPAGEGTAAAGSGAETPAQDDSASKTPPASESAQQAEPEAAAAEAKSEENDDEKNRQQAKSILEDLVKKYNLNVVALGNGTACRETEEFLAETIGEQLPALEYVIVNEAGASVYSVSSVGKEEFPDYDATLRGAVSIGRRLQDHLAELVKIDPQHIGVGLYQHDVPHKHLKESLDGIVESCVNQVGVDVNTASIPLLRHVAGLNQLTAREIVQYRKEHGPFRNREQLMQVPGVGENRFIQAAGFLKIYDGENPLDMTWIHPESYDAARKILEQIGCDVNVIKEPERKDEFQSKLKTLSPVQLAKQLEAGEPTVRDILDSLLRPGRDPREDLPMPIFRKGIRQLEDLQPGMELKGTVLNVVDFGAFVDVGLKASGLVHISQMANRFVKNPHEVVAVGDVVSVWVLKVDLERRRVSLSMIPPGSEKKPHERPPRGEREGGERPPRRRRGKPSGPPAGKEGAPRHGQPYKPHGRQPAAQTREKEGRKHTPRPPRKPRREPPKPKLSRAALEGREDLRSFGELSAFFAAKKTDEPAPAKEKQQPPAAEKPASEKQESPPPSSEVETASSASAQDSAAETPATPASHTEPAAPSDQPAAIPAEPAPADMMKPDTPISDPTNPEVQEAASDTGAPPAEKNSESADGKENGASQEASQESDDVHARSHQ